MAGYVGMTDEQIGLGPACSLCRGVMDGSVEEVSLFTCRDCGTTLTIPNGAWYVAASKRLASGPRRRWADDVTPPPVH